MTDFKHEITLDDVDEETAQAMQQMFDAKKAAMGKMAQRHRQLQDRVRVLQAENAMLKTRNEELKRLAGSDEPYIPPREPDMQPYIPPPQAETAARSDYGPFALVDNICVHGAPVHGVAMYKDSSMIATASWDQTCKLYKLGSKEVVRTLGDPQAEGDSKIMGGLYGVAFAKTADDIIGCASCDKSVYLWNHATGQMLNKLTGHTDEVNGLDFHASQQVIATAGDDCKAIVWDFQEGIVLRTLDKHLKPVYGCTFLGQENQYLVATACFDQSVRVFDMRDKQMCGLMKMHTDDVIGIAFSPVKQIIATGSDDGKIGIWDVRTYKLQREINTLTAAAENEVKRVEFSMDGAYLAAACSCGKALVYDMNSEAPDPLAQLDGHSDCVFDVAWGADPTTGKKTLVSASHDHTLRCWQEQ